MGQSFVVGGTLIVATENKVSGLNPASGAVRWRGDFGNP
jgi:hypothetical protein